MRILPGISQPTLDSFRKDVYRPRLALLFLLLLLGGKDSNSSKDKSDIQNNDGLDQDTKAATSWNSMNARSPMPSFILDYIPFLSFPQQKEQQKEEEYSITMSSRRMKRESRSSDNRKSKSTTVHLSSASPLHLPRIGFQLLWQGDVLSAIVPLHILWAVRLVGMMIEDTIVRSSVSGKQDQSRRISTHNTILVQVCILALIASVASILSSSNTLLCRASSFPGLEQYQGVLPTALSTGLWFRLPQQIIVFLELSATLLSLLSPLMKLNHPRLSQYLPSQLRLPSPSHAPSLIDLLPLPPGLADIISGRASDMQSRVGRRGNLLVRRSARGGPEGMMFNTGRHGALPGLLRATVEGPVEGNVPQVEEERSHNDLLNPLTLPGQDGTTNPRGKAPRLQGMYIDVDSSWLLENGVILWSYLIGALEYLIVILSLPNLTPTSLPPILALLSLRSQIGALVATWTSARKSLECLEFVRRRWPSTSQRTITNSPRWRAVDGDEILCPVCLESIQTKQKEQLPRMGAESCLLDCGHELHAVCLVQIFLGTKQTFCPCCHDPLKATPPSVSSALRTTTEDSR